MKKALIALAALGFANAALASEWAFDDTYWKQPDAATSYRAADVQANRADDAFGKYSQVDRYNP